MNFLVSSPSDVSYRVFSPGDLGAKEAKGQGTVQGGPAPWTTSIDQVPLSITVHMSTHFPVYRALCGGHSPPLSRQGT